MWSPEFEDSTVSASGELGRESIQTQMYSQAVHLPV